MIKIYGTCIVGAIAWCAVAQAQPYANIEMNRIYPKGSYVTTQYEMQVGYKKKNGSNSKNVKFLEKLFPNMKKDEVELLARISTKKELFALGEAYGMDKKSVDI